MKLIGCLLLSAAFALGQSPAEIQLKAATHKQEVQGDLKGAMEAYRQIIAKSGKERGVVAQAMLRLARCHEKLGQVEARKLYEEIASSYGDQAGVAAEARQRLAGMGNSSSTSTALTARHVQTSTEVDAGSLSVDGKLMVMTHWDSGDIAIRDMASGQVNRLNLKTSWDTSSDFAQTPVFSQEQKQIAYAWYSTKDLFYQLRVVTAKAGAKPRILVNSPELEYFQLAGWSSDGKLILAAIWRKDQTSQLAWISASDGTIKVLKSLEWRNPGRIELSPDGRYIAYDVLQQQDRPDRDIYILSADGSRESALATGPVDDAAPSWFPDGSRIAFLSNRSGQLDLLSVNVENGKPQGSSRIAKADIGNVTPVGFSSSGCFYYVSSRSTQDIFAVGIDPITGKSHGSSMRLSQAFFGRNERAAWSPDGKWVAFHSRRGHARYGPGAVSLVVRSINTGEEKVFPANFTLGQRPVWFHTGAAVLEAARDVQGNNKLQKLNVATGKFEMLRATRAGFRSVIALASDDQTIYAPVIDQETSNSGVARFDLARTGQDTLLYNAPDGGIVTGLSLSADGRRLALMLHSRPGENRRQQVAVVGVDGNGFRQLIESTQPMVPVVGLAWSPDSRWVYFVRVKTPESEVWRVPADGGSAEYTGIAAPALRHINLSADGSRLAFTSGELATPELWALENLLPSSRANR